MRSRPIDNETAVRYCVGRLEVEDAIHLCGGGGEAIFVADDGVESVSGGKGGTLLVCSGKYVDDMREYILEGELPFVGPATE